MARFHINNSGDAGPCGAVNGRCPFGGDEEHYPTLEAAREAFEQSMAVGSPLKAATKTKTPTGDMFISILGPNDQVVTERHGDDLSDLEPGVYSAQYVDPKTGKDRYISLTVDPNTSASYEHTKTRKAHRPKTSKKTLDAFTTATAAYSELLGSPTSCEERNIDRTTLSESTKGVERVLSKYDLSSAVELSKARMELEDIEWALDHDIVVAKREGKAKELNALSAAREPLATLLNSLKS